MPKFFGATLTAAALLCLSIQASAGDELFTFLNCRRPPNVSADRMSVYLKLHPLRAFERQFPVHSTSLGNALSGYDVYSIASSQLQLLQKEKPGAPRGGDPVGNSRHSFLAHNYTPDSVMLIRGNHGFVFPTAFLADPMVSASSVDDADLIATFYLKDTSSLLGNPKVSPAAKENDTLRELIIGNVIPDGSSVSYAMTGPLVRSEFIRTVTPKVALATFVNSDFEGGGAFAGEGGKKTKELGTRTGRTLADKSIVWILHRKMPCKGLTMHVIVPVKDVGRYGMNGSMFRAISGTSASSTDTLKSGQWEHVFGSKLPRNLTIKDGDRLELTFLDLSQPFNRVTVE